MNKYEQARIRQELQAKLPPDFPPLPDAITPQSMSRYINDYTQQQGRGQLPPLPESFTADDLKAYIQTNMKFDAGKMIKNQARLTIRNILWSLPLSLMPMDEYDKRRINYKLKHGYRVGLSEFVTGQPFSLWRTIRTILFIGVAIVVAYSIWYYSEHQAFPPLIENIMARLPS